MKILQFVSFYNLSNNLISLLNNCLVKKETINWCSHSTPIYNSQWTTKCHQKDDQNYHRCWYIHRRRRHIHRYKQMLTLVESVFVGHIRRFIPLFHVLQRRLVSTFLSVYTNKTQWCHPWKDFSSYWEY